MKKKLQTMTIPIFILTFAGVLLQKDKFYKISDWNE